MKTFAKLGGVKFEVATIEGMMESTQWEYKPQDTIADKTIIQFVGAKPRTLDISARLHAIFCKPDERLQELKDEAKKTKALPFILSTGRLVGFFVITDVGSRIVKTDDKGFTIAMELTLKLTETSGVAAVTPSPQQETATDVKKVAEPSTSLLSNIVGIIASDTATTVEQLFDKQLQQLKSQVLEKAKQITGEIPIIDQILRKIDIWITSNMLLLTATDGIW